MQNFLWLIRAWLRRPMGAAFMSFIFPGLGQATGGQPRRGGIVAIPGLAVLGALILIVLIAKGSLLGSAFDQSWLTSLLLVDVVFFVYHVWAVADAYVVASRAQAKPRRRGPTTVKWASVLGIALIVSSTVLIHGAIASVDLTWQNSVSCVTSVNGSCMFGAGPTGPIAITSDDPGDQTLGTDPPSGSVPPVSSASAAVGTFDPNSLPSFINNPGAEGR